MADRKLYLEDFAEFIDVRPATLRAYRTRGTPPAPEPDGVDIDRGHACPWWHESTVKAWDDSRRGPGRRHGSGEWTFVAQAE